MTARSCLLLIAALAAPIFPAGGCAKPNPHYFPPAPLQSQRRADGGIDRLYDADHDGRADCFEHVAPDGIVRLLAYDDDGDGQFEQRVELRSPPDAEPGRDRQLLIVVDSIPFDMIHDLWQQGRFRLFHPPSRVISPFPVMTDPCLISIYIQSSKT